MHNIVMIIGTILLLISLIVGGNFLLGGKRPLPPNNFPFRYRGHTLWYSRSVAVTNFVFAKNTDGIICVLANKRGDGAPDFNGMWNCPCGYLDFNETGEEGALRETFEETSVQIPKDSIRFWKVNTSPTANRQNVTLHYISALELTCEEYPISDTNSEEKEVSDIKWIPLHEIDNYEWAFGHKKLIEDAVEKQFCAIL